MRLICLISGGIDSPVAAHMMGERGAEPILLHMDNVEGGGEELNKVRDIAHLLQRYLSMDISLYHAPHFIVQESIARSCDRSLQCVLCKRFMMRAAARFSAIIEARGVVTGDSLGQVASQTLHNIGAVEHGLGLTVLRPLIGLDKLEIEAIAKCIGTFERSIADGGRCPFLPSRPATKAGIDRLLAEESRLPIQRLVNEVVEGIKPLNL